MFTGYREDKDGSGLPRALILYHSTLCSHLTRRHSPQRNSQADIPLAAGTTQADTRRREHGEYQRQSIFSSFQLLFYIYAFLNHLQPRACYRREQLLLTDKVILTTEGACMGPFFTPMNLMRSNSCAS